MVIAVGDSSCIGRIEVLLQQDSEATPLQQKLETIAKDIGKFGLAAAILTFAILILRFIIDRSRKGDWTNGTQWLDIIKYFILSITVVVLAIPEGLPLAVTLSLAYSVRKMYKDNNLVRRLQACETMGGANMICSDKTGTLTQNKMSLVSFWNCKQTHIETSSSSKKLTEIVPNFAQELFLQAIACNLSATLRPIAGSSTEIALLEFLEKREVKYEDVQLKYLTNKVVRYPFSSKRKRMSTLMEYKGKSVLHTKGASEVILSICRSFYSFDEGEVVLMDEELRSNAEDAIKRMADQALRTITIAYKEIDSSDGTI